MSGVRVVDILSTGLDRDVRARVLQRYKKLSADITYHSKNRMQEQCAALWQHGWPLSRIDVVAALNAFDSVVLLAHRAWTSRGHAHLATDNLPIRAASLLLNDSRRNTTRKMLRAFDTAVVALDVRSTWLEAADAFSLIREMHRDLGI